MRLDFGVGISTGEVFAGTVGSEERYEYTVIGNPVNEAARLQERTRELARRVLLTAATAAQIRAGGLPRYVAALLPIDRIVLRGKSEATTLYSVDPSLWRAPPQAASRAPAGPQAQVPPPAEPLQTAR